MRFTQTPLYQKQQVRARSSVRRSPRRMPVHIRAILLTIAIVAPVHAFSTPQFGTEPFEQEFAITAYYSPLKGQCCYVRGSYEEDIIYNGEGHTAADGTAVYPGMIAAPPTYPFGTRVEVPGVGTFTVHDRGGAIQEQGKVHRLDIWAGHGEEGLARALAFGIRRVSGTVYPPASHKPAPRFTLASLVAPIEQLRTYFIERSNFLALRPKLGDRGLSVAVLQKHLSHLGYFNHALTGFFGPVTRRSFVAFLRDYKVDADRNMLSENAAAHLVEATRRVDARAPFAGHIDAGSAPQEVAAAQRVLRFLGYYRGRTDGVYSDDFTASILEFQKQNGIVASPEERGAGRIGPSTRAALLLAWNRKLVTLRAGTLLTLAKVAKNVLGDDASLKRFVGEGDNGSHVRNLQKLLVDRGYFPAGNMNGNFGPLTKEAVTRYQLATGIIAHRSDRGAGYVGPATLENLRNEERNALFKLVRAEGLGAL